MTQGECKTLIAAELYTAMDRLGADPDLLSIIGSYGDTLTDEEILSLLREYNAMDGCSAAHGAVNDGGRRCRAGRDRLRFFGAATSPSRTACLRASLPARRAASAFSRAALSDGFS